MNTARTAWLAALILSITSLGQFATAAEVLFEDNFDDGLSPRWKVLGLKKEDYRIRDGGLEMRVQPGKPRADSPMIQVVLPFTTSQSVVASVEITPLDQFTEPEEAAGLFLTDGEHREFAAQKKNIEGRLVFSPGYVEFIGEAGEEGDPSQYAEKYWPANEDFGPLRIIIRSHYAHFQVGPAKKRERKYLNFFHSAIRNNEPQRGFCVSTSGGPTDHEHWVRFDNFKVTRN